MTYFTLQSDGTPQSFTLVDENGVTVDGVLDATLRFSSDSFATLDLTIVPKFVNVRIILGTVYILCPHCGEQYSHECEGAR